MKEGDKVWVYHQGKWREGVLIKHKPYSHRLGTFDGYDIHFTTGIETCKISGVKPPMDGWFPVKSILKCRN